MIELRSQAARGAADFGWLKSRHSFSFGRYYDPQHMGFSALRVINDDWVAPGAGFDTHGHRDMEIISLVLEGSMAHRDSAGHQQVLQTGQFQLMSAGRGIEHSEFNASRTQPLKFLQIWITPNVQGQPARYQEGPSSLTDGLQLIASATGEQQSLVLKQDAKLWHGRMLAGESIALPLAPGRLGYLHLYQGQLLLKGPSKLSLQAGDGLKVSEQTDVALEVSTDAAFLWFDLPSDD